MIRHIDPLIRAVTRKREDALTDTDVSIARLVALAGYITQGKDILFSDVFDRPVEEIPPERMRYFTKGYAKWNDWLVEYEKLLAQLHRKEALPDAQRCQRCGLPVHVPWQSREACEHCDGPNKEVFAQMVRNNGWVLLESKVLKERIVVCRDTSIPITKEQRGLVRYTVAEVVLLENGKPESLKLLHAIKKHIGGRIVE
ncbi:MAG: hypothetical protein Q7T05_00430 [Dehalococcoidia bacterium]|nr:hypothetical protein [Dehalococcoidia bacterium]